MLRNSLLAPSLLALLAVGCSDGPSAADLNKNPPASGGNSSGGSAGSGPGPTGGAAGSAVSGGAGGSGGETVIPGGAAGTGPMGGTDGGGSGPTAGTGGMAPDDPNVKRSGKFKMLVYSKTAAFRHDGAITTGKALLNTIATEIGIDPPTVTEDNAWLANINDYELLFFMNPTGDIFTPEEQTTFETWMKNPARGGAFCGVHSATDTENGWAFYSDVTGQYYDGHGTQNQQGTIEFEPTMLNHPALVGLPNPWPRAEEWYNFNSFQTWTAKPGFQILGRKNVQGQQSQPVVWVREHDNFRSFYTAIGHDGTVFQDPDVKKHLTGGIMWTVRREHCLAAPKPAGCP